MEYSYSSWDDEDFVLEFPDDECSNAIDQTKNYGYTNHTQRDSKWCESSQLMHDYFAQLKEENYFEHSVKSDLTIERKNEIIVDEEQKRKCSSKHLTSPTGSLEKQQEISQNLGNDNISDKMVNFSKLINQLLNAKVVIERMCENSGKSEQFVEKRAMSSGSRIMDSVQLYCPKCQNATVVTHRVSDKKSCSKCESTLKYLCSKCNKKHYEHYESLCRHYKKCKPFDSTLKKLNPSDFLVKKMEIDFSKKIIRYCSTCDEVDVSCSRWVKKACENCDQKLLYQCRKCKAQYTTDSALRHHMQSQCYPYSLYKCKNCEFTSPTWKRMRQHVINAHLREKLINEPHTQPLSAKVVLRKLEEFMKEDAKPRPDVNLRDQQDSSGEKYKEFRRCNLSLLSDKSKFTLDRNQFIVKEFQTVSSTEKWTRHCPTCEFVTARPNDRRCSCGENFTYVCKKCNVKCSNYDKITYHAENYCFPTHQYKCTHCEFSNTGWKKMKEHFESKHADLPLIKCELCSYETIYEYRLKWHAKLVHRKNVKKFCCSSCSYSTNFKKNLQRHVKMNH